MYAYDIGLFIKNARESLGITQNQLCLGICDRITLSRIEQGKQAPSNHVFGKLMERLGLPKSCCQIFMTAQDFEIAQLQREITKWNISGDYPNALEKIAQLEQLCAGLDEPSRALVNQYLLRAKAQAGYYEGEEHKQYSLAAKREMLLQALEITCPGITLETMKAYLLGEEEAKIINQLAITHSEEGNRQRAMEIYRQLLKYIQSHLACSEINDVMLPLTAYNYSRLLGREQRIEEAIEIAELGRRCCIRSNKCRMLGGLLLNLACCYHDLGDDEKSKEFLVESYYVYKVLEKPRSCKLVKNYAWETFQLEID